MLDIKENYPLQELNTFGISVKAAAYSRLTQRSDLPELVNYSSFANGLLVFGGGSNFLFTKDIQEWVIHNQIKGIDILEDNKTEVRVEVGAGERWHDFVRYAIRQGWGGIENLSLIPGSIGAAPIQNIGAYGMEVKDSIVQVKGWHIDHKVFCSFDNKDCRFGYRDSIFKQELRGKVIITSVIFKLQKQPRFNIEYGSIHKELKNMKITKLSLEAISAAVIKIRQAKLPNPNIVGNGGSFFKNPIVSAAFFKTLLQDYPEMPHYKVSEKKYKIPAARLIEKCGWKGYREGNFGVHPQQPLVLVNYGNALGKDIYDLSCRIIDSVSQKFGLALEREVWVYGI